MIQYDGNPPPKKRDRVFVSYSHLETLSAWKAIP
jgi:hypothetical protein